MNDKRFVTYLTTYSGKLLPRYYIGSTRESKILSGNYFGSIKSKKWSKIFNSEIKNNKQLFSVIILSFHDTRKEAIEQELKLQIRNNVIKSCLFFNESMAAPNGFFGRDVNGQNNPFYNKIHTEESKQKRKETLEKNNTKQCGKKHFMWGKKHSVETLKKQSNVKLGNKYGSGNKGKKTSLGRILSKETRKKIGDKQNKKVYQYINSNLIKIWDSCTECAKYYGVSKTTICRYIKNSKKYSESIFSYNNSIPL